MCNCIFSYTLIRSHIRIYGLIQMQKTSPTAGAFIERIRLPVIRQQQSRNQAKYREQLQLQFQSQLQLRQ